MAASARDSTEKRPPKRPRELSRENATLGMLFPPAKKSRSDLMQDCLLDFPDISADKKFFRDFTILTHETTDFSLPIVSIGAPPSSHREILVLDPQSEALNLFYTELIADLEKIDLAILMTFVGNRLKKAPDEDMAKKVNALLDKWIIDHQDDPRFVITTLKSNITIPIVPAEYFIEHAACFCRLHSLIMTFILFKLIREKKLAGSVFHCRDTINNGKVKSNHSWAILKTFENEQERVFIIDTVNWQKPLELHKDRKTLVKAFGEESITRMEQIYWSRPQPVILKKL